MNEELTDLQKHAKMVLAAEACEGPVAQMLDNILENAAAASGGDRFEYVGDAWAAINYAFQMIVCEAFERIPEFRTCHRPQNFNQWHESLRQCINNHVANGGCSRSKDK